MDKEIIEEATKNKDNMVNLLTKIISIKAISPLQGGNGELERAKYVKKILEDIGLQVKEYNYNDEANVVRPNLVTKFGNNKRTIWLVTHLDTVAEGDISLWTFDPFKGTVKDGKVYGRGSVDNGHSLVASIYALKILKENNNKIKYNVGLALVADEENGSKYGIQKLLNENIFQKDDMFLVPDWGNGKSDKIEIAEKGILWLKITVIGKQCHASTPEKGINAYRYSIKFLQKADELLHKRYNKVDLIFDPNISTFEMTKHEKNLENVNIIPGKEITYMDCRVLPVYKIDDVIKDLRELAKTDEFKDVNISFEFLQNEEASATKKDAEIIKIIKNVIKEQYNVDPIEIGIGGGTCAGFFRRKELDAIAWSTSNDDEQAHQPNEYTIIENMVNDVITFAHLYI